MQGDISMLLAEIVAESQRREDDKKNVRSRDNGSNICILAPIERCSLPLPNLAVCGDCASARQFIDGLRNNEGNEGNEGINVLNLAFLNPLVELDAQKRNDQIDEGIGEKLIITFIEILIKHICSQKADKSGSDLASLDNKRLSFVKRLAELIKDFRPDPDKHEAILLDPEACDSVINEFKDSLLEELSNLD